MVNFDEEKKWWRKGYKCVVGLDEAGRGPLAGPVVAAAIVVRQFQISNFKFQINDSKKLSAEKREEIYKILTSHSDINWGVGIVSEKVIDKVNILEASKLAMEKSLHHLYIRLVSRKNNSIPKTSSKVLKNFGTSFLLIDGNFKINSKIPQKSIIKGDSKVFSIAAASIIAKVTRDRLIEQMHKKYPSYGFHLHKGYGTSLHVKNLKKFGPSRVHRKTFQPVADVVKNYFV